MTTSYLFSGQVCQPAVELGALSHQTICTKAVIDVDLLSMGIAHGCRSLTTGASLTVEVIVARPLWVIGDVAFGALDRQATKFWNLAGLTFDTSLEGVCRASKLTCASLEMQVFF
ncbi:MAG: hypothetical protein JJ908_13260 [Rhizobiales bacterium]|nr:hypothetical protein [Hyphomicrobiales bacterium]MBO6699794.1 hypothetical protein [Hyphomicrobiales bacterium]MBO6737332.1 hypothetical protein [Hyphomicrobiales bacterium]MBO6911594.1 hypothetical protein [Hyphomicrobiales bacterium]MBO6954984.1 hypothetical protein [Hyphomicrobiales bacterium]